MKKGVAVTFLSLMLGVSIVFGQSTEFSYQGQLQNSSAAATGTFDFEFALFNSAAGGSQIGSTLTRNGVNVANGIFSVSLDFGNQFDGSARFLEIRVAQSGGAFTTLSPRQSISSSPYSVRSLSSQTAVNAQTATTATNATNLTGPLAGDVTGTQGSTTVARLRGTNVAPTAPANGQVLKFNSGTNQWQPATDETASGGGGGGTITGVTAGTGLTGGGASGNVTVGIANSGVGNAQLANGSVSAAKIPADQVVKSINGLRDDVTLTGSSNITITPSKGGNSLILSSPNSILNQTVPQAGANFNIAGNGTVGGTLTASNLAGNGSGVSNINANNIATGTIANARIGELSTANLADSAVTSAKIANGTITASDIAPGQVVTGINSLKNDVTLAAGSNVTITPAGNTLTIAATAAVPNPLTLSGSSSTHIIRGENSSSAVGSAGIFGVSTALSGRSSGGFFTTSNVQEGQGVFGSSTATTGLASGVRGESASSNGRGVVGIASNNTGAATGVIGESLSVSGYGVYGMASASSGTNYGVYGDSSSPSGFAGYFNGRGAFTGNVGIGTTTTNHRLTIGPAETPLITTATVGVYAPSAAYSIVRDTTNNIEAIVGADPGGAIFGATSNNQAVFRTNNIDRMTIGTNGFVTVNFLAGSGANPLCHTTGIISSCSSSLRYKSNVTSFGQGMSFINKLRPIAYDWTNTGMKDVGFGAEDIAKIDPRFVTYNAGGEVEGVKYDRLSVAFVNAFKEQQTELEARKAENDKLKAEVNELKAVVCSIKPDAIICLANK